MKTSDFIRDVAQGKRTKPGYRYTVMFDGKDLFSYGHHYPLLVRVGGKWFLNDAGYSVTTRKHIGMAAPFADGVWNYRFMDDPVTYWNSPDIDQAKILGCVRKELAHIKAELRSLRASAFRKRGKLEMRQKALRRSLRVILRESKAVESRKPETEYPF